MIAERKTLSYPIMVCRWKGWFCMFQADYTEKGLYYAAKGSVLSFPESEIEDMDDLSLDDAKDVFPVEFCRSPSVYEIEAYNKKKTV